MTNQSCIHIPSRFYRSVVYKKRHSKRKKERKNWKHTCKMRFLSVHHAQSYAIFKVINMETDLSLHFNFMYGYDKCSIAVVLIQVTAKVNVTSKESSITLPRICNIIFTVLNTETV